MKISQEFKAFQALTCASLSSFSSFIWEPFVYMFCSFKSNDRGIISFYLFKKTSQVAYLSFTEILQNSVD